MFRVVRRNVTVSGTEIPVGATAILMYGSGNRDDTQFDSADQFKIDRHSQQHLSFGHGTHFCVGARLSRLEAEIALTQLCQRLTSRWVTKDIIYKSSFVLSGPQRFGLDFSGRIKSSAPQLTPSES